MKCPFCNAENTRVIDSRPADDAFSIRRRRQCDVCDRRFTTYEKVETMPLAVIKKDDNREPYSREKLQESYRDIERFALAEHLDADMLIILTAVEKVAINFNKPDQKGLDDLTPAEARKYMEENQFAKGSMLPKVQAAVKFAESKAGRTALITLLEKAKDGIEGKTGTRVHQ